MSILKKIAFTQGDNFPDQNGNKPMPTTPQPGQEPLKPPMPKPTGETEAGGLSTADKIGAVGVAANTIGGLGYMGADAYTQKNFKAAKALKGTDRAGAKSLLGKAKIGRGIRNVAGKVGLLGAGTTLGYAAYDMFKGAASTQEDTSPNRDDNKKGIGVGLGMAGTGIALGGASQYIRSKDLKLRRDILANPEKHMKELSSEVRGKYDKIVDKASENFHNPKGLPKLDSKNPTVEGILNNASKRAARVKGIIDNSMDKIVNEKVDGKIDVSNIIERLTNLKEKSSNVAGKLADHNERRARALHVLENREGRKMDRLGKSKLSKGLMGAGVALGVGGAGYSGLAMLDKNSEFSDDEKQKATLGGAVAGTGIALGGASKYIRSKDLKLRKDILANPDKYAKELSDENKKVYSKIVVEGSKDLRKVDGKNPTVSGTVGNSIKRAKKINDILENSFDGIQKDKASGKIDIGTATKRIRELWERGSKTLDKLVDHNDKRIRGLYVLEKREGREMDRLGKSKLSKGLMGAGALLGIGGAGYAGSAMLDKKSEFSDDEKQQAALGGAGAGTALVGASEAKSFLNRRKMKKMHGDIGKYFDKLTPEQQEQFKKKNNNRLDRVSNIAILEEENRKKLNAKYSPIADDYIADTLGNRKSSTAKEISGLGKRVREIKEKKIELKNRRYKKLSDKADELGRTHIVRDVLTPSLIGDVDSRGRSKLGKGLTYAGGAIGLGGLGYTADKEFRKTAAIDEDALDGVRDGLVSVNGSAKKRALGGLVSGGIRRNEEKIERRLKEKVGVMNGKTSPLFQSISS